MGADMPAVVERWTPETEDVVSRIAHQEGAPCKPCHHVRGFDAEDRDTARAMLEWLAEAGLLLPPGGVSREEWRVIYRDGRGQPVVWSEGQTAERSAVSLQRARAEGWPGAMSEVRRDLVWPDGTTLLGPWIEVPNVG